MFIEGSHHEAKERGLWLCMAFSWLVRVTNGCCSIRIH